MSMMTNPRGEQRWWVLLRSKHFCISCPKTWGEPAQSLKAEEHSAILKESQKLKKLGGQQAELNTKEDFLGEWNLKMLELDFLLSHLQGVWPYVCFC